MSDQSIDTDTTSLPSEAQLRRKAAMATLAEANPQELQETLAAFGPLPSHEVIRPPETGLIMARGRMGGTGSVFNLGEVTVTRCVIRLESGETGSSYILGRNKQHAHDAAVTDALWQVPELQAQVQAEILAPLEAALTGQRQQTDEETAATRVDFFTMVRGDD